MATASESISIKQQKTQISRALNFFTLIDNTAKKYVCNICKKELSGRKLNNLISHFKVDRLDHKDIYISEILGIDEKHILVQREEFIHSAVELVTINSESFALLSKSGFRNGHQLQLHRFRSAGCPVNLSDEHVYEIKEKVRTTAKQIKELIKSETCHKIVSIMVDSATRNGRSIYGVSLQYKHNGVLKIVAIGMRELKQSHTAIHLADVLLKILAEYEIALKQVLSITTDNGSNMLAMVKEVEHILLEMRDGIGSQSPGCEEQLSQTQLQSTQLSPNDDNIDDNIDLLLKTTIDNNDVLDELFGDEDFYKELFDRI